MRLTHVPLASLTVPIVSVAVLLAGPPGASGAEPSRVYVTTGAAGQVLVVDPAIATVTTVHSAAATLSDLTVGADGRLYVASPADNWVLRIDPAGDVVNGVNGTAVAFGAATGAEELRFSAFGHLFYNGSAGVGLVGGSLAGTDPGRGLAFTTGGELLAGSGGLLVRLPVTPTGAIGAAVPVSGVTTGAGLAVATGGEDGAVALGTGDIAVVSGNQVLLYGKNGVTKGVLASWPAGTIVNYIDFDAEDRLWVATMTSSTVSNQPNGRLWAVEGTAASCADTGGVNCRLVATAPRQQGKYAPFVGLALAASSRTLTKNVPAGVQDLRFDFGAHYFEATATFLAPCTMSVSSAATTTADATALVSGAPATYTLNRYLGEEHFTTVYQVRAAECQFAAPEKQIFVAALGSVNTNPRILRCVTDEEAAAGGESSAGCTEVPLFGFYETGPIDGDAAYGGRTTNNWSDWLIVNEPLSAPGAPAIACGLLSPFKSTGTSFNSGSTIAVKTRVAQAGGTCAAGPYESQAQILISVAQVADARGQPAFAAKRLPSASGNSNDPPLFRYDPRSQQYIYDLSLKDYAPGVYELTLTDLNNLFAAPPAVRFTVTPSKK